MVKLNILILKNNALDKSLVKQAKEKIAEAKDNIDVLNNYLKREYVPSWASSMKDVYDKMDLEKKKITNYESIEKQGVFKN